MLVFDLALTGHGAAPRLITGKEGLNNMTRQDKLATSTTLPSRIQRPPTLSKSKPNRTNSAPSQRERKTIRRRRPHRDGLAMVGARFEQSEVRII
jgi:hypothetical protein